MVEFKEAVLLIFVTMIVPFFGELIQSTNGDLNLKAELYNLLFL